MNNLKNKKLFLLDMDGTIYLGDTLFDGTLDFLEYVKSIGGRYIFMTNNSSKSVDKYIEKLAKMSIVATKDDFLTSANATVIYLKKKNYDIKIEAMCWMQGESDSFSVKNATDYEEHLTNFIDDIRKEFKKYASDDGIAFVDAYIANNPVFWVYCEHVNNSKSVVAGSSLKQNSLFSSVYNLQNLRMKR